MSDCGDAGSVAEALTLTKHEADLSYSSYEFRPEALMQMNKLSPGTFCVGWQSTKQLDQVGEFAFPSCSATN